MIRTIIALLALALMLAACGDPTGWAGRDVDGSAVCPAGQHVIAYGPSGIPACAAN
jgi:predicted small secreted protein